MRARFETVGSISAIVIGVASLFVAMNEADSVRRQQAASVLPIVKMTTLNQSEADGTLVAIQVENVGIGPAFLERQRIIYRGEPLSSTEELRMGLADDAEAAGFWTARLEGEVIGGSDAFVLISASWLHDDAERGKKAYGVMQSLSQDLELGVCYCSVFEDCWTTSLNATGRPEEIASCEDYSAQAQP